MLRDLLFFGVVPGTRGAADAAAHSSASGIDGSARGADKVYKGHIPELDGLRAFGISVVVLNHAWATRSQMLELGWILMDSFFVLSGFLIVGILLDTRDRPDFFRSFYARRSFRIFPLYYLTLSLLVGVLWLTGDGSYATMVERWGSPFWFFAYLGNIPSALLGDWPLAARGAFIPLWSLQIEEQFYLLIPLLVYALRKETLYRVFQALVGVSLLTRLAIYSWAPNNDLVQYVLLPAHMDGLALGALIALRFRMKPWKVDRRRLSVQTAAWVTVTVASAVWAGYQHDQPFIRTFGFFISSIACTHLVLWLILFRGSRGTSILRLRPVVQLGKISYGIYLLHWPILYALLAAAEARGATWFETSFVKTAAVAVLSLVAASLSWRYFERPLLDMRARIRWAQ